MREERRKKQEYPGKKKNNPTASPANRCHVQLDSVPRRDLNSGPQQETSIPPFLFTTQTSTTTENITYPMLKERCQQHQNTAHPAGHVRFTATQTKEPGVKDQGKQISLKNFLVRGFQAWSLYRFSPLPNRLLCKPVSAALCCLRKTTTLAISCTGRSLIQDPVWV